MIDDLDQDLRPGRKSMFFQPKEKRSPIPAKLSNFVKPYDMGKIAAQLQENVDILERTQQQYASIQNQYIAEIGQNISALAKNLQIINDQFKQLAFDNGYSFKMAETGNVKKAMINKGNR